jgi:carbon-monoxide dehydrogenase small subunit
MENKTTFKVNGKEVTVEADPLSRLLDILRDELNLTGVKEGCGEGECGACAVWLDGELVNSCLVPLTLVEGREVTTIEGFRGTGMFKVIESSFSEAGAVQCGFCTPGMVMAAGNLLKKNPHPDEKEARTAISGQLCRCTGYQKIVEGTINAAEKLREKEGRE